MARVGPGTAGWVSVEQFGGTGEDRANGVAVMLNGNACVVGDFNGALTFANGNVLNSAGGTDGFLAIYYGLSGVRGSAWSIGGPGDDTAKAVAAAWDGSTIPRPSGNEVAWLPETFGAIHQGCVVVGEFTGTFMPPLGGWGGNTSRGGTDVYYARVMASLRTPSTFFLDDMGTMGGPGNDVVHGVGVANRGTGIAAIAGAFEGQADFYADRRISRGKLDGFVAEYLMVRNPDPFRVITLGGLADDEAWGASYSSSDNSALSWGAVFDSHMTIEGRLITGRGRYDGFFRAQ